MVRQHPVRVVFVVIEGFETRHDLGAAVLAWARVNPTLLVERLHEADRT